MEYETKRKDFSSDIPTIRRRYFFRASDSLREDDLTMICCDTGNSCPDGTESTSPENSRIEDFLSDSGKENKVSEETEIYEIRHFGLNPDDPSPACAAAVLQSLKNLISSRPDISQKRSGPEVGAVSKAAAVNKVDTIDEQETES